MVKDKYGVTYSDDYKCLVKCPDTLQGRYVIPEGVIGIYQWAFFRCKFLTEVIFPNSLGGIGESAFQDCYNLTHIELPDSIKVIGRRAFDNCKKIKSISFPQTKFSLGENAFLRCESLQYVVIPGGVGYIRHNTFSLCFSLRVVILEKGIIGFDDDAFSGCPSLTVITIPYTLGSRNRSFKNLQSPSFILEQIDMKIKFLYPFSGYSKNHIEFEFNKWLEKGEFERTTDWQNRLSAYNRSKKIEELTEEAKQMYFSFYKSNFNFKLLKYDADNEFFLSCVEYIGAFTIHVPFYEAEEFKRNWDVKVISFDIKILDDLVNIDPISISMPNGKIYYAYYKKYNL